MVYLFLTENHETVEALTPIDVLRRANVDLTTVSLTDIKEVTSSCGVSVFADATYDSCDFTDAEALVLPGGPGVSNYLEHPHIGDLIVGHYKKGRLLAAICAAPKVLAKNGIHVKSTIYPPLHEEISDYCAEKICVSGNVITGNAMAASLDFSLKIVEHLRGKAEAQRVADAIFY